MCEAHAFILRNGKEEKLLENQTAEIELVQEYLCFNQNNAGNSAQVISLSYQC
ncbi:MAG: hypothetical protein U9N82_06735 [Thermodesulfobacteriota bacterium]|nr:hypothetical protein [Thermodesulfobacteriota bacterium]